MLSLVGMGPGHPKCVTQEAIDEIKRCSGTQFDPAVVEVLRSCQAETEDVGRWTAS